MSVAFHGRAIPLADRQRT